MATLGYQPHMIERVLNYVSGTEDGLTGIYQRHDYREDRKRARLTWSARIIEIVAAENAILESHTLAEVHYIGRR